MHFFKKMLLWAIFGSIFYMLIGYHYIIIGQSVKMLKKSKYSLMYTIYNTNGKRVEVILKEETLWKDGIGELLVKNGRMSEDALYLYKEKRAEEEYEKKYNQ